MMLRKRYLFTLLLLLGSLLASSCWDRREIEELGITIGMSIDSHTAQDRPKDTEGKHQHKKLIPLSLTFQHVNPKIVGGGNRSNPSNQKPYLNVTSTGDTAFQILRETSTRTGRPPYFMHLKIVILGEDVARRINMAQLLNLYLRNNEMRRTVYLTIAKGRGKDVLEAQTKNEDLPSLELLSLVNNLSKSNHIAMPISVGTASENLATKRCFLVPRVVVHQKEMKLAGGAVINGKTGKMLGWLSEAETAGINLIQGSGKSEESHVGGIIESAIEKGGEPFSFEIDKAKSRIIPQVKNGQVSFTVKVDAEGSLGEDWNLKENAFDRAYMKKIEQATAEQIKKLIENSLQKIQKEFQADVAGFGKKLHIRYPEVWHKLEMDWDERFSKIPIHVEVKVQALDFALKGKKKG